MNAKEILRKIKAAFEDTPVDPANPLADQVPAEFKEYALADGTKVKIDNLAVGGKVMIVNADGTETKAPEGEHMLATGEAIEVDAEGLIYEIKSAVAAQPDMMSQFTEKFADLEAANKKAISDLKAEYEKDRDELKKTKQAFKELTELVETLIEEPGADPIEPKQTAFSDLRSIREERRKKVYGN